MSRVGDVGDVRGISGIWTGELIVLEGGREEGEHFELCSTCAQDSVSRDKE